MVSFVVAGENKWLSQGFTVPNCIYVGWTNFSNPEVEVLAYSNCDLRLASYTAILLNLPLLFRWLGPSTGHPGQF
jgi:hypothetical protein